MPAAAAAPLVAYPATGHMVGRTVTDMITTKTVRVDIELHRVVSVVAAGQARPIQDLVDQALVEYLDRESPGIREVLTTPPKGTP